MLKFLPAPIVGIIALLLYTINLFFWTLIIYLVALIRLIPVKSLQNVCNSTLKRIPNYWQDGSSIVQLLTSNTQYEVHGLEQLQVDEWYLMLPNHQTWADILVLEKVFDRRIPILKFFMKKQLLWGLPLAGWACRLLDFPFMERYSKEKIAKHPELKGKDLETTKRACERFKLTPTTIITFPEGTRFTAEKHQRQNSPYQHLLRPRAGGVAFTLGAMADCLHKIIDVSIVYPSVQADMWEYLCGKPRKIIVNIRVLPITPDLIGDYESDREFRVRFQEWLNQLWLEKDQLIGALKREQS